MKTGTLTMEKMEVFTPYREVNGVWRVLAVALFAALVTLCGAYFSSRDYVTRVEVEKMMQSQGPYIEDRKEIQATLDDHTKSLNRIEGKVDELAKMRDKN